MRTKCLLSNLCVHIHTNSMAGVHLRPPPADSNDDRGRQVVAAHGTVVYIDGTHRTVRGHGTQASATHRCRQCCTDATDTATTTNSVRLIISHSVALLLQANTNHTCALLANRSLQYSCVLHNNLQ
jgi:hypothetical protein